MPIGFDDEVANPQEVAADAAIEEFRQVNSEALMSASHPQHARLTNELMALYEKRFPEQNKFDPVDGVARPENSIDQAAEEALQPLSAEEFEIGPDSDFGVNVDQEKFGWDGELEAEARRTFAAASLNNAQARTAAQTYYETIQPTYDVDTAARQTTELLAHEYGGRNVEKAIAGTNRMIRQIAGDELYKFIGRSGLGAHPRFVGEAVRVAKQRGYW